jgi:hypothetical protein
MADLKKADCTNWMVMVIFEKYFDRYTDDAG